MGTVLILQKKSSFIARSIARYLHTMNLGILLMHYFFQYGGGDSSPLPCSAPPSVATVEPRSFSNICPDSAFPFFCLECVQKHRQQASKARTGIPTSTPMPIFAALLSPSLSLPGGGRLNEPVGTGTTEESVALKRI